MDIVKYEKLLESEASGEAFGAILMVDFISKAGLNRTETLVIDSLIKDLVYVQKINLFGDFFSVNKEKISLILDVSTDVIDRTIMKMVKAHALVSAGDDEYFFMPF